LALAAAASTPQRLAAVAAAVAVWLPLNLVQAARNHRHSLECAADNRAYVAGIERVARIAPPNAVFVFDRHPEEFRSWAIGSALRYYLKRWELELVPVRDPHAAPALNRAGAVRLNWEPQFHSLDAAVRSEGQTNLAYLTADSPLFPFQSGYGWYRAVDRARLTEPAAEIRLARPSRTSDLEIRISLDREMWLSVILDHEVLWRGEQFTPGPHVLRRTVPAGSGESLLELLGGSIRVESVGFVPSAD
jgi:hypothetical protein